MRERESIQHMISCRCEINIESRISNFYFHQLGDRKLLIVFFSEQNVALNFSIGKCNDVANSFDTLILHSERN